MKRFLKHNGLSIFFLVLFLGALFFQAVAGHADFNEDQDMHGNPHMSFGRYVLSSQFGSAVLENWQSEYLQFTLFILTTVWLLQRGSPESKELDKAGRESDEEQRVGEHAGEPRRAGPGSAGCARACTRIRSSSSWGSSGWRAGASRLSAGASPTTPISSITARRH